MKRVISSSTLGPLKDIQDNLYGIFTALDSNETVLGHFADINRKAALKHLAESGNDVIAKVVSTRDIASELSDSEWALPVWPSLKRLAASLSK
jgi:hypothetical protein